MKSTRRTPFQSDTMHPRQVHPATILDGAFWEDVRPIALSAAGLESGFTMAPDNHLLFATSGSSGDPKWIALSKEALLVSARAVNKHLNVDSKSIWGLALPIHHVGGFGVIARAFVKSCELQVFEKNWDPEDFSRWTRAVGVTHTSLVPTQLHDLVHSACSPPRSLHAVVVGGGRLDPALGQAARRLGWPVLASYGLTEAASQVATQSLASLEHEIADEILTSLPHWELRVDAEGCLEIRGAALFSGIVSGGRYHPREGEWFLTRDRVELVPGGLVPRGRADFLVKVAGELLDPLEVEARLAAELGRHGIGIAVLPVEDARLGHRFALIAEAGVPEDLIARAVDVYHQGVPRSQRFGDVVVVPELPRSELGKIQRQRLREMVGRSTSGDLDQAGRSK